MRHFITHLGASIQVEVLFCILYNIQTPGADFVQVNSINGCMRAEQSMYF